MSRSSRWLGSAVMDLTYTVTFDSELDEFYNDALFSWGGDLETFLKDMKKYSQANGEHTYDQHYAHAMSLLGTEQVSYFSQEDLLADIDGLNVIKAMIEEPFLLSVALEDYYSSVDVLGRYDLFVDAFGGEAAFRETVYAFMLGQMPEASADDSELVEVLDDLASYKRLMNMFSGDGQYEFSDEMRQAAADAFIDIVLFNREFAIGL